MADETTEAGTTEGVTPKRGGAGLLPTIGGVTAGVALGIGLGLFVLGPRMAPASEVTAKPVSQTEAQQEKLKNPGEASPMYLIDNLVLNPAGSNGTRFLLMSVALEVKDEGTLALLKARDPELRDNILRMFGSKTAEQMSEATSRDSLRAETLTMFQQMLPSGLVRKVYFPQFVIQ